MQGPARGDEDGAWNHPPTPLPTAMRTQTLPDRMLWRWYLLLLVANELDLAFTYLGLSRGTFFEANPLVQPHLYTLWPIVMKLAPLAGLALAVFVVVSHAHHLQSRVLGALRLATAVYAVVLVLHILHVLTTAAFAG
jgi:hypothetical protein